MENFDEIIFDDDEFLDENETFIDSVEQGLEPEIQQQELKEDLTTEILRLKGISNPEKIKFEDESGAIVERAWNNLSKEELLNILAGNEYKEDDTELTEDEIDLLNTIRNSGLSINDYLKSIQPEPQLLYKIDELSDDDLYVLDILEKVGGDNITDEELSEALESAKKNEKLFQKTVEGLRTQYLQLEKDQEMRKANEIIAKQQELYNNFASSIMNEIKSLNTFAGQDLELSNEDIEELSSFMLQLDEHGMSPFGKAMQNPALFTKAAFWLLNEDKIIEELTKQMQDTYTRGYENAKKDMQGKSKLVFNATAKNQKKINDDWYADDDEW